MIDDIADGSHLTGFADWAVGVMEPRAPVS